MHDGDNPSGACGPLETSPRPGRLKARAEFLAVAAGRRFHTARLTLQGLRRPAVSGPVISGPAVSRAAEGPENRGPDPTRGLDVDASRQGALRIGFTVTKRVGHATERNRIRRRLRAAADTAAEPWTALALDVVLVGRREALASPFAQLVDDIARGIPAVARPKSPAGPGAVPHHGRGRGGAVRPPGPRSAAAAVQP